MRVEPAKPTETLLALGAVFAGYLGGPDAPLFYVYEAPSQAQLDSIEREARERGWTLVSVNYWQPETACGACGQKVPVPDTPEGFMWQCRTDGAPLARDPAKIGRAPRRAKEAMPC